MGVMPSDTGTGVSLRAARGTARTRTDWKVWAWFTDFFRSDQPKAPASNDDAWGGLFVSAVVVYVIIQLYVNNVFTIAVALFWLALVVVLVTMLVFLALWWRRVFDGHGAFWAMLSTVLFAASGAIVAYWLIEPPLQGVLAPATAALAADDLMAFLPYLGPLLLQILGALASFILLFSSLALCGANVAAVLIASGAWGSRWLWLFVFWTGRWTTGKRALVRFGVLAVLSAFAASGLATEWISSIELTLPVP